MKVVYETQDKGLKVEKLQKRAMKREEHLVNNQIEVWKCTSNMHVEVLEQVVCIALRIVIIISTTSWCYNYYNYNDNDDEYNTTNDEIHFHILKPKLFLNLPSISIKHFRTLLQSGSPVIKFIQFRIAFKN